VEEIVFVGGSSKMRGLIEYFQKHLDIPIRLGSSAFLKGQSDLEYLESTGLALRAFDKKWNATDPDISTTCRNISDSNSKAENIPPNTWTRRTFSKKFILAALIVPVFAILMAFSYISKTKDSLDLNTETGNNTSGLDKEADNNVPLMENKIFDVKIPIAINEKLYGKDRISGILIENSANVSGNYEDAIAYSKVMAAKDLSMRKSASNSDWYGPDWLGLRSPSGEDYTLYNDPIYPSKDNIESDKTIQNRYKKTGKLSFKVGWIGYSSSEANRLFTKETENLIQEGESYTLNNIKTTIIEKSDNPDILYLAGKVDISLNKLTE